MNVTCKGQKQPKYPGFCVKMYKSALARCPPWVCTKDEIDLHDCFSGTDYGDCMDVRLNFCLY